MKRAFWGAVMLGALAPSVHAADAFDAAAAFGAREEVRDVSLSPDGKLLALVRTTPGRGERVEIVPVSGGVPRPIIVSEANQRLRGCVWPTSTRLICTVVINDEVRKNLRTNFVRRYIVDADGRNLKPLKSGEQWSGAIVDLLPGGDGNSVLLLQSAGGLQLDKVDMTTLQHKVVERGRTFAGEYITDGYGTLRIIGETYPSEEGYSSGRVLYCYRLKADAPCQPLSTLTDAGGFNPMAVDRDLNAAYGFEKKDGRQALYRVSLDGSLRRELVLADPKVDVDGLIRIGRQGRVVGASFASERRQIVMFDPALKKLAAGLSKALPKLPNVAFVDASADESKLLLIASSDVDPGRYYLFDRKTRELNELVQVRPDLAAVPLAEVKPVTYPAADGSLIPGYLTLPPGSNGRNLPAMVMPHGGPGARDEWGFDWWAQYFANRGFAVLQPNFRGSTGYGDVWFKDNGFKSWRLAIGDVNDGGRWLVKQGIAASDKLAIVGWSYGGYAALQSSVLDGDLFKAVIAVAPVTDLRMLRAESQDFTNFTLVERFIGKGPHLSEGSPLQNVEKIKAPVLMFHGDQDLNVGYRESVVMDQKLRAAGKASELVLFKELDHQLDDSSARTEMLRKSDAFLRKVMRL